LVENTALTFDLEISPSSADLPRSRKSRAIADCPEVRDQQSRGWTPIIHVPDHPLDEIKKRGEATRRIPGSSWRRP